MAGTAECEVALREEPMSWVGVVAHRDVASTTDLIT